MITQGHNGVSQRSSLWGFHAHRCNVYRISTLAQLGYDVLNYDVMTIRVPDRWRSTVLDACIFACYINRYPQRYYMTMASEELMWGQRHLQNLQLITAWWAWLYKWTHRWEDPRGSLWTSTRIPEDPWENIRGSSVRIPVKIDQLSLLHALMVTICLHTLMFTILCIDVFIFFNSSSISVMSMRLLLSIELCLWTHRISRRTSTIHPKYLRLLRKSSREKMNEKMSYSSNHKRQ